MTTMAYHFHRWVSAWCSLSLAEATVAQLGLFFSSSLSVSWGPFSLIPGSEFIYLIVSPWWNIGKVRKLSRELYIFMPPKELWEAYSNRTVRPSVCPSVPLRVRCISPIFFELGIPNLVCGCILGWRSVAYHFRVTVTLTLASDLVLE